MAPNLPNNPDLQRFRRDSRRLQRAVREGDPAALELVTAHHPEGAPADPVDFPLHAAQLVVARAHGFPSWPAIRRHQDLVASLGRDPAAEAPAEEDPADAFCRQACLTYSQLDHPDRRAVAARLLSAHPDLPDRSTHAAAAAADPHVLAAHLREDPAAASREGGPFGWAPLLYLTYSRVSPVDAVAAAEVLLDAGADVNAGFLWQGLTPPFTALTGVFGEGEQGAGRQPRHPQEQELARLLLTRGADPNDGQALYNRMFRADDSYLELLFEFGLGAAPSVWQKRLGASAQTVEQMLQRQVEYAAQHGFAERLALLARHGWGTERPPAEGPDRRPLIHRSRTPGQVLGALRSGADVDAVVDGRTALHVAAFAGDVALVRALLEAGADPTLRDAVHDATPLGWAEYACQGEVAMVLRQATPEPG
ncbi:MAG: hypothetical protein JNL54_10910 [Kineosporiaceae bacterium]|nr:hypothetical protein [Kineosporiaceae bacterium]